MSGGALFALGQWIRPALEAEDAYRRGDFEAALTGFEETEARFDALPAVRRVLPSVYEPSVTNQLALLYRLKRADSVLDKSVTTVSAAPTHFWAACALFGKGLVDRDPDQRVTWITRAQQEFRSALELDPNNWDAKYNYELTTRLLIAQRQQPKAQPEELKLLRPDPKGGGEAQPARRVG